MGNHRSLRGFLENDLLETGNWVYFIEDNCMLAKDWTSHSEWELGRRDVAAKKEAKKAEAAKNGKPLPQEDEEEFTSATLAALSRKYNFTVFPYVGTQVVGWWSSDCIIVLEGNGK
jgi:hypothetical protein